MNLILLILGRLYNINISSYTKTIQIMQYYYAINRASRRRPPSSSHLALFDLAVYTHLA